MNKQYYPLYAILLTLLVASCSPETENVFDGSPAARQQQAMERYADILEKQQGGWALDFYPSELELGGIAYTAYFADGHVTLACEEPIDNSAVNGRFKAAQEVTSDYRLVNGRGVVLTFDTYNALLHYWSQPSGTDFDGYASDYEFTFVTASADSVVLRGVKHGNLLRMYPLDMPASEYLAQVADMRTKLSAINRKRLLVDGVMQPVTMMESHMAYVDGGVQRDMPFVYTPKGLRFYEPVVQGGVPVMQLMFDAATGSLVSADGRVQLPMPTAIERFCAASTQWHFVFGSNDAAFNMCDELRDIVKSVNNQLGREKYETLKDFYIGLNKLSRTDDEQRIVMGWTTSYLNMGYEVSYGIDMTVADEQTLSVDIRATERGNLFYNYTLFAPLLDFVVDASPFSLAFDDEANPTSVRLTSRADAGKWFVLRVK